MDVTHTLVERGDDRYENKTMDMCSSQSILFSLISLVSKVPKTLFTYSAYPFPCG
jgi:hypothetical protein